MESCNCFLSQATGLGISVGGPGNNWSKGPEVWYMQGNGQAKAKSRESNREPISECGNCNLEPKEKGVTTVMNITDRSRKVRVDN